MTTLEILRAARALISQPGRWCQGSFERDANGNPTAFSLRDACQFCAFGAVGHVSGDASIAEARAILADQAQAMGFRTVPHLNDTTDLPTVLAMFDATIARLESQG